MKKFIVFAMVATVLTIFNGCQKDELKSQLADEVQPQEAVKPDVYVEKDYLVLKDYTILDSLKRTLNNMSLNEFENFEKKVNFTSAFTFRKRLLNKADNLSNLEISSFLDKASAVGYFDKYKTEFIYPFYNESLARVLNPEGKLKIGNTFYLFKGNLEIITADLNGLKNKDKLENCEKTIELETELPSLKSGEELESTLLADNRLRCSLKLIREEYVVYDWIIVNGQVVWGVVGHRWEVYYRFYSYKQYTLYKSDRPTYFNWKTKEARIGGNDDFWYLNYYNANPYTERSTQEASLIHFVIYDSGLIQSQYPVSVSAVHVSDFWSDYMSSFHGTLIYP